MTEAHFQKKQAERGAALLIVLLLAATLSFVALASMERTSRAAARAINVQARGEALWRAFAAEALAQSAIEAAYAAADGRMSLDDPWAAQPLDIPFEEGGARLTFADATACFNINSLAGGALSDAAAGEDGAGAAASAEFVRLAVLLGLGEFDATSLAEALGDWVDEDAARRPQGVEDGYYTALPSPYRTGNQPMASASEMRAARGFTREIYAQLKPFMCAAGPTPSVINVNMLSERHAPLLAAVLGDEVTIREAADIIGARPVGGYRNVEEFLAESLVQSARPAAGVEGRFAVTSRRLRARAEIVYNRAVLEMTTDIAIGEDGETRLIARRIGAEE